MDDETIENNEKQSIATNITTNSTQPPSLVTELKHSNVLEDNNDITNNVSNANGSSGANLTPLLSPTLNIINQDTHDRTNTFVNDTTTTTTTTTTETTNTTINNNNNNNNDHGITNDAPKQKKTSKFILSKFTLYETKDRMYVVGSNKRESMFRILEIDLTMDDLTVLEDPNIFFTRNEIIDILAELENSSEGGLHKKLTGYALLGFIRFTSCYYLVIVTKLRQVAVIGGHSIFHIDGTELIPISNNYKKPDKYSNESKLMSTFQNLDLTKTFYFSYTYDITNTLQTNLLREKLKAVNRLDISIPSGIPNYNEMFMWNKFLLLPLFNCITTVYDWFQCIIHGFIDQVNVPILSKNIYITLIARRSHHFAGARFLKRGVNTYGYVANEVETEQIVIDMSLTPFHQSGQGYFDSDRYTSFVQHRGSIPLYWIQEASNLTAKPPIKINVVDPFFSPAALHFDRLFQRYGGGTIQILNLIKTKEKTPRETKLLREFEQCIIYLNKQLPETKKIDYISWDMSRASKQNGQKVIEFLETYALRSVSETGIFHNYSTFRDTKLQEGICRSNCIDCLDRTNAAQFVIGKRALGVQLQALGIVDDSYLEYDSDIVNILTELFHDLGDTIALQYGGSHLVNTMETYRKINQWSSHSRDMVESIKRFYSNSFMDSQRQNAINLFLGNYIWEENEPPIWELNTDFYLHNESKSMGPKRSYTHWWNEYHMKSIRELIKEEIIEKNNDITIEKIKVNIRGFPDAFDNYWNEYYLPRSLTWITDLFTYNMNSTRKYQHLMSPDKNNNDTSKSSVDEGNQRSKIYESGNHSDNHNQYNNSDMTMNSPFVSRKQSWINKRLRTLLVAEEEKCRKKIIIIEQQPKKDVTRNDEIELSLHFLNKLIDNEQQIKSSLFDLSHHEIPILLSSLTLNDNYDEISQRSLSSFSPTNSLADTSHKMNINDVYPFKCISADPQGYSFYSSQINLNALKPLEDYTQVTHSILKATVNEADFQLYHNSVKTADNDFIFVGQAK